VKALTNQPPADARLADKAAVRQALRDALLEVKNFFSNI